MTEGGFYFAQLTDIHIGGGLNPKEAAENLGWARTELEGLDPRPKLILVTGDLVCRGKAWELRQYSELMKGCSVPSLALPANHDLWGEGDDKSWREIVGPLRQSVEVNGVRFLLWNDIQRRPDGDWQAELREEQREWFKEELNKAGGKPVIIGQHSPLLPVDGDYYDVWCDSNGGEFLNLLREHKVLALVTGHWHRNGEWLAKGVRVLNTGALCGWQWNAVPPHYCFPTRPGYRLFHFDGRELRSFWRDGSYWSTPAPKVQVSLARIGDAHTGGPRPQVRPIDVFSKTVLHVTAYAPGNRIANVEWSIEKKAWYPMRLAFDGIWSEWEAEIDPKEWRALGEHVCIVRAEDAEGDKAYDAVPVRLAQHPFAAATSIASQAGREMVFELFSLE